MFNLDKNKIQMPVVVLFFLLTFILLSSFLGLRLYFYSHQLSSENYTLNWNNNLMKTDLENIAQYKQEIVNWEMDWYKPLLEDQKYKYSETINYSEEKIKRIAELEKYIDAILESYHTSS
jgi:hypothetical protein